MLPLMRGCRLIASGNLAERDHHAVPAIDRDHRDREVHQFGFAELPPHPFIQLIRHIRVRDLSQGFSPFERGALAMVKNGVSRHVLSVYSRCSLSPAARASLVCMSRQ